MRFEPIETLPSACPLFVEEAYDALVNELRVTAWHWHEPSHASELERFLMYGESRHKQSDFFEIFGRHEYQKLGLFDHVVCFKSMIMPFALTMPYGDPDGFYRNFKLFVEEYYRAKGFLADSLGIGFAKAHKTEEWGRQFRWSRKIVATIVPNRFKLRDNGDFAAIIAQDHSMFYLSEAGNFPVDDAGVVFDGLMVGRSEDRYE